MGVVQQGEARAFTVVGIHLGGTQTCRSAVVRGQCVVRRFGQASTHSPATNAAYRSQLEQLFFAPRAGGDDRADGEPMSKAGSDQQLSSGAASPLILDAFVHSLGPEPDRDADVRLTEVIADMGRADCYVIDVPLGLPPCTICALRCPGSAHCQVAEVAAMHDLWRVMRKRGSRSRAPQPYLDRYWDYFCRNVLDGLAVGLRSEFESPLGSNRSPLAARARYLARWIESSMGLGHGRVLETNSTVSAWAWHAAARQALALGPAPADTPVASAAVFRAGRPGRSLRKLVLDHLVQTERLGWGGGLARSLVAVGQQQPEVFLGALSALTARCLAVGDVFLQDEFLGPAFQGGAQPWLPASAGLLISGVRESSPAAPIGKPGDGTAREQSRAPERAGSGRTKRIVQ